MASQEEREGKGGGTQGKHVVKTRSPLRLDYLFGLASGVAKNIHYVEEQEKGGGGTYFGVCMMGISRGQAACIKNMTENL
eukprot:826531-Amorphochlora_amoeboformis.AAC.2